MLAFRSVFGVAAMLVMVSIPALAVDKADGAISFKSYSAAVKFAWIVRGPDEMNEGKNLLRIYLSTSDIGAKIKACTTLSCADKALGDGAMVDYSDARHLGFAVRLNNGLAQYSGGTDSDAFKLSTNTPDHLVGKLHIDDSAMGGAKVDADFDLTLLSTFKTAR